MKIRKLIGIFLLCSFFTTTFVVAEENFEPYQLCSAENSYTREDRNFLLAYMQTAAEYPLKRMAELASQSATEGVSQTQRSALSAEFEALKEELNRIGEYVSPNDGLSQKTYAFLDEIIDQDYLKLREEKILGEDENDSIYKSRFALDSVNRALFSIIGCLAASYEEVEIDGTQYSPFICRRSYSKRDKATVLEVSLEASRLLMQILLYLEEGSSEAPISVAQREVIQANITYALGELELLGEKDYDNISQTTSFFLKSINDPVFLNIHEISISAPTSFLSEQLAKRETRTLRSAYLRYIGCLTTESYRPSYRPSRRWR